MEPHVQLGQEAESPLATALVSYQNFRDTVAAECRDDIKCLITYRIRLGHTDSGYGTVTGGDGVRRTNGVTTKWEGFCFGMASTRDLGWASLRRNAVLQGVKVFSTKIVDRVCIPCAL